MLNVHNHLLAETLAADGIGTRWSRLGVIGSPSIVWLLIIIMELMFVIACHTSYKAASMYTFVASYVVILTIVNG